MISSCMPKRGDVRGDGKVFVQLQEGREYWAPMEVFLRLCPGFYERRADIALRENEAKERVSKLKRGDVRERDGWIFFQYLKGAVGGEHWVPPEKFFSYLPNFYERRDAYRKEKERWAATKEIRLEEKKRKANERYRQKIAALTEQEKEDRRRASRESYAASDKAKEMQRLRNLRRREKMAPIVEARKAERLARKSERDREIAEKRAALDAMRELRRVAREARDAARVPRVVLTDEERKAKKRAWKKSTKGRESVKRNRRNGKHRRRALLRGLEAKATPKQISEIKKLAKGLCFYCRVKTKVLTLDHIVPIAKGGGHTVDNIVFACHACNSEKRDLDPAAYAKQHGMLLV